MFIGYSDLSLGECGYNILDGLFRVDLGLVTSMYAWEWDEGL